MSGKRPPKNPRSLRPATLLQILNGTPLGTALTERQFHTLRMRAGTRIGDGRTIDMLRFGAWLVNERDRGGRSAGEASLSPATRTAGASYEAHKERAWARQEEISRSGRDIGELPAARDPARRERCRESLQLFAETYMPNRFNLEPSPDHITFWQDLEHAVRHGGLLAVAMPRGSGKTTMVEAAAVYGVVYGFRRYIVPLGPTRPDALKMLRNIKGELESNDLLLEDFPEVCYPIQQLQGIAQRSKGQLCQGQRTNIEWGKDAIVLPTIEGSPASSAIIEVRTITGAIRGMRHMLPDGSIVRPDLVLCDDFQTKKSAKSVTQCEDREATLHGDVLGLAGPSTKIACFVTCTVIRKGDAADRILDTSIRPQWQGKRVSMVRSFPTNEKLWDQYGEKRREGLRQGDKGKAATAFYRKNRKAMDVGAKVYWPARHDPDEISAVQHAMNKLIDDEESFHAECQNQPVEDTHDLSDPLEESQILAKVTGIKRGVVPLECQQLLAYIDVQKACVFSMVCGFGDRFSGHIVDYGTWPDQQRNYFTLRDAKRTIARQLPGAGLDAQLFHALTECTDELMSRQWLTDGGTPMTLSRIIIDAAWGDSTDAVYKFCRESKHRAILMPSFGVGITARNRPMTEYQVKKGERLGHNWIIPIPSAKRGVYTLRYDTNYWKSFVAGRIRTALGDHGSLSIFQATPAKHRMLIEHLTAEQPKFDQGPERTIDQWSKVNQNRDNHWWDCLVGCHVAASMLGITTAGRDAPPPAQRKKRRRRGVTYN